MYESLRLLFKTTICKGRSRQMLELQSYVSLSPSCTLLELQSENIHVRLSLYCAGSVDMVAIDLLDKVLR